MMSMKMTKGTVAIGAGVVLLLGGAGTYALWQVNEPLEGTVQTGDLNLELGTPSWTHNGEAVADVAAVQLVPGDVVSLTQPMTVTAIGDDLQAELSVVAAPEWLPAEIDEHFDVTLTLDEAWATDAGDGTYRVSAGDQPYAGSANVTITFDANTPDREAVNTDIDLSDIQFSLQQVELN